MTDDELIILMKMNIERAQIEKEMIVDQFYKMDDFINQKFKENSKHQVFKTKKTLTKALQNDFNPYNTFQVKK